MKRIPLIISIIPLFFCFSCEKPEREAKVETGEVIDIMATSARVAGEIIDVGEGITEHGHCWGFGSKPTITDLKTTFGHTDVTGNFTSELQDLEAGKLYYVRAYVMSGSDVVYGKSQQFITKDGSAQVVTAEITDTTINSAKSGGNILSVNGDEVIGRGVCWDTVTNFTLLDCISYTEDSLGLGSFTSELTNLVPGITYRVKAYAITTVDTSYGETLIFSTLSGIATLTSRTATNITATSAISGGTVIDDGGAAIITCGVCWNTTGNPTISENRTVYGSYTGSFPSNLTGLQANTIYYVRAYAINSVDTAYGAQINFKTRDGIATLITNTVTNITTASATSGGNITDDGGAAITARGVCWNTIGNPDLFDNKTNDGSDTGSFTSQLTGLQANTGYYVRAYATTDYSTSYGDTTSFLTKGLPEVKTSAVSDITDNSAVCGGNVTNDWGFPITVRGVCWNTSGNPTLESNLGYTSDGSGSGSFISNLTGLTIRTTYYVRAYATNSIGTSYGEEKIFNTFECGTSTITDYDGNIYNTVQIGSQCWMKENLKTTHYNDGTALIDGTGVGDIHLDDTTKYWFVYSNNLANKYIYGLLYTWAAAMNGAASSDVNPSGVQGVCPTGWHLPSDAEWKQLEIYLGMSQAEADAIGWRGTDEGGKMKETGTTHWSSPNTGATNSSGFTALPGGCYRGDIGNFPSDIGNRGHFWSSTEYISGSPWYRHMDYNRSDVGLVNDPRIFGFSVRCIRDEQ